MMHGSGHWCNHVVLLSPKTLKKIQLYLHTVGPTHDWFCKFFILGKEGHWIWNTSLTDLTESFWGAGHPNINHGNCAVMVAKPDSFRWEDTSCLTTDVHLKRVAPICQHERWTCPEQWIEFERYCYFLDPHIVRNWHEAETDCVIRGGHLASVHSKAVGNFLYGLSLSLTGPVWIGGSDEVKEVQN